MAVLFGPYWEVKALRKPVKVFNGNRAVQLTELSLEREHHFLVGPRTECLVIQSPSLLILPDCRV